MCGRGVFLKPNVVFGGGGVQAGVTKREKGEGRYNKVQSSVTYFMDSPFNSCLLVTESGGGLTFQSCKHTTPELFIVKSYYK